MQDVACANYRSRKIKCDRERPRCGSCARDQVQCTYSSPAKRVNHLKVLAQGFDDIQNRLVNVQQELRSLTTMFQGSDIADGFPLNLGAHQNESHMYGAAGEDELLAPSDGHLVRDEYTARARPRGRRTPPRQFLTVVLDNFFGRDDYTTDILVRSAFYDAIERTYTEPSNLASDALAVCFNLVILLVIGPEQEISRQDPFIQPLVRAAQFAARNPAIFLSPRLVNVQALALLSLLARQSYSETLGDALFAQAGMLAKAMGLDRAASALPSSHLSPEEGNARMAAQS
ncbi:hypothetical protein MFIFM68171_07887 [Madurella fahalii]|uniref:Zn(2)-C6 fungal-type domain-containing protein n=1 Tax=Madurella fahalii TaxID=1157608 RepID=A0ABQ0GIT7_9PEZI